MTVPTWYHHDCEWETTSTSAIVWKAWTAPLTITHSCAGCDATSTTAWVRWTTSCDGETCTATPVAWHNWVAESDAQQAARREREARVTAEWERGREARAAVAAEAKRKQEEADARAEALLKANLDAAQLQHYETDQSFYVVAASGTRYRVRHGWAGNVDELDDKGRAVRRFCIHPKIGVPKPDNMLCQKLMLETDEPGFRRIANITTLRETG